MRKSKSLNNLKLMETIQDIPVPKTTEAAIRRKQGLHIKYIQLIEIQIIHNTVITTDEGSKLHNYYIRK